MYSIKDKVIVITGASGVICSCFVNELAKYGVKMALLGLDLDGLNELAQTINARGGNAKGYLVDVLNKKSLEDVQKQIHKDFGKCDILINGAGGNSPKCTTENEFFETKDLESKSGSFFDLEESGFNFVFNLNLMGTILPTQVFAKDMIGRKGCSILNISSASSFFPLTKIPAYSGAKAAINNFTQWAAVYFSKQNIRVNAIAPGFFVTTQNKDLLYNKDGTPTARTAKILAKTPLARFGQPEELLGALMFLVDDTLSSFVTGVILSIDGGFNAYSGV